MDFRFLPTVGMTGKCSRNHSSEWPELHCGWNYIRHGARSGMGGMERPQGYTPYVYYPPAAASARERWAADRLAP